MSRYGPSPAGVLVPLVAVGSLGEAWERATEGLPAVGAVAGGVLFLAGLFALLAHWMHGHAHTRKKQRRG